MEEKDIYQSQENKEAEREQRIVDLTMAEARRRTFRAIGIFVFIVAVLLLLVVYFLPNDGGDERVFVDEDIETASMSKRTAQRSSAILDPEIEAMTRAAENTSVAPEAALTPQQAAEAMGEMRLARAAFDNENWNVAEEHVRKALSIYPEMNSALRMQGLIYTHRGQFDQAIITLEEVLKTDPFSAEVLNNLATAYMQRGNMEKAEELLLNSLQMNPNYTLSHLNLGLLYLARGDYAMSVEYMEHALPQVPGDVNVRNNLGVALLRLGRYDEAREHFRTIMSQKRDMAPAYFNMAITYALQEQPDAAIEWIEDGAQYCSPMMLQRFLQDTDFDGIREEEGFRYIVQQVTPKVPQGPVMR